MQCTIEIENINKLSNAAEEFLSVAGHYDVYAFYGGMGAGKTTFIKALCDTLNVIETVNSPTFAIINEYNTDRNEVIFHFDFYRINKIEEAFDMGVEDYFYSGCRCFIEWPEKIESILPENCLKVRITAYDESKRKLEFEF